MSDIEDICDIPSLNRGHNRTIVLSPFTGNFFPIPIFTIFTNFTVSRGNSADNQSDDDDDKRTTFPYLRD